MKDQDFISLILYVHNNEKIISNTLKRISNVLNNKFLNFEIILINDFSTDQSKSIITEFINNNKKSRITLINLSYKHGLENSIFIGVDFSVGDFIIEIDSANINFDEKAILSLYEKSQEGYDIVSLKANKNRNFSSTLFYVLMNCFLSRKINLDSEFCTLLTRKAVNAISNFKNKTKYRKILHDYSGCNKTSIITKLDSKIESSAGFNEKIKIASDILFSFTNLGYKLSVYMCLLFLLISASITIYTIYQYMFNNEVVEGWTTLMLFISFSSTGLFTILLIISKYFSITLKEIGTIPESTIESIYKN